SARSRSRVRNRANARKSGVSSTSRVRKSLSILSLLQIRRSSRLAVGKHGQQLCHFLWQGLGQNLTIHGTNLSEQPARFVTVRAIIGQLRDLGGNVADAAQS